jgi:hypothetical protein
MKAVRLYAYGDPTQLRYEDTDIPQYALPSENPERCDPSRSLPQRGLSDRWKFERHVRLRCSTVFFHVNRLDTRGMHSD